MGYDGLTGPRECEKSGEFKAGGVFFRSFGILISSIRDSAIESDVPVEYPYLF